MRVHTDPVSAEAARRRKAAAFTAGSHLVFAAGAYDPYTDRGLRLLAHEVAHVLQQRIGSAAPATDRRSAAEREGREAGERVAEGGRARPTEPAAGFVQRQDAAEGSFPVFSDRPGFQLELDPEIRAMALRHWIRWSLGLTLTGGDPAEAQEVVDPSPGGPTPQAEEAGVPSPDAGPGTGPRAPPSLPPQFTEPVDPDALLPSPDMAGVMAPYLERSVPAGTRDVDAAREIYRRNAALAALLPDLRAMAPSFLRPLIPGDWRREVAVGLTSATIDAALRHDWPTPLEAADRSFERLTGVSTTYVPIPFISSWSF